MPEYLNRLFPQRYHDKITAFLALPEFDRKIAYLMAMNGGECSRELLLTQLKLLGIIRDERGAKYQITGQLKSTRELLEQLGWVTQIYTGKKIVAQEHAPVLLWLCAESDDNSQTFQQLADARRKSSLLEQRRTWAYRFQSEYEPISPVQEAYYLQTGSKAPKNNSRNYGQRETTPADLLDIVGRPFDIERIRRLSPDYYDLALWAALNSLLTSQFPITPYIELADEAGDEQPKTIGEFTLLGEAMILSGQFERAEALAEYNANSDSHFHHQAAEQIRGWIAFIKGDDDTAITRFEAAMEWSVKGTRKRKTFPSGHSGLFYLMALLRRGDGNDHSNVKKYAKWGQEFNGQWGLIGESLSTIQTTVEFLNGNSSTESLNQLYHTHLLRKDELNRSPLFLISSLCCRWTGIVTKWTEQPKSRIKEFAEEAESNGLVWLASEAFELLAANAKTKGKETKGFLEKAGTLRSQCQGDVTPLVDLIKAPEPWERTLTALESLADRTDKSGVGGAPNAEGKRLLWLLVSGYSETIGLIPYTQIPLKSGKMGRPRKASIERLKEELTGNSYATAADISAIEIISAAHDRWSYYGRYGAEHVSALEALAGSQNVYIDESFSQPAKVVKQTPEVSLVATKGGRLKLKLLPDIDYDQAGTVVAVESDNLVRIITVRQTHVSLNRILQASSSFPAEARERLVASIGKLSSEISIESGSVGFESIARSVKAQTLPEIRLVPDGEGGILVNMSIQPIPDVGEYYLPGEGKPAVYARSDSSEHLQTERDLPTEVERASAVIAACATLQTQREVSQNAWKWHFTEPDDCLELLLDLDDLDDNSAKVTWPEGAPLLPPATVSASQFRGSVKGSGQWLEANGELRVDDNLVLTMKQLMELLEQSNAGSRFIELSSGRFLALTRQFRRQLDDLRSLSTEGKGGTRKFTPMVAFALADLEETTALKTGTAWKSQLKKIRKAQDLQPTLPKTLKADLRAYQLEGYEWLARLAEWGAGACLADDMGLGKTVQALALLLNRARGGPALVIAPTSVAANWIDESLRFAPTLNIVLYTGPDRTSRLTDIGSHTLVITTYGILQRCDDQLTEIEWNTVVLDEAQAIKNRATKRSQTAMKLRSAFRIATTGTPIENRLEELHNLFAFLNPGLLGSTERFRKNFADPIERHKDADASDRLRRITKPFILRRLKHDVLKDLPPKTEVTLHVELGEEEAAFYEALRQKAISSLESSKKAEEKNAVQILAEITRLRRACCHPKLVQPKGAPESSKQRVFIETLTEILDGGHQVLVFSQFVDHLKIARKTLDDRDIEYQYLDGSTSTKKRKVAIDAFQSGEGSVFLISLKAGGSGLNLTAADYVIHLDPWWNPAVEDQASDRAHRIGQLRPVTVYRLVTKGTIEEKIVALHHQKRDLASAVLAGTDTAGSLTSEQMLTLLREAGI